jgi:hypothetical protein
MEERVLRIRPQFLADGNNVNSESEKARQTYPRQDITSFFESHVPYIVRTSRGRSCMEIANCEDSAGLALSQNG